MNWEEKAEINHAIDVDGMDYTFRSYSNFDYIKDERFHELRQALVKALNDMEEYLKIEED